MSDYPPPQSLIIVGAGMAGIKVAHECLNRNANMKILIIEANDYVGGRMRNFNFEGHTVEMGANWISGLEITFQNPIWKLAKLMKMNGHHVDRNESFFAYDLDGNNVTTCYQKSRIKFETIYQKALKSSKYIQATSDVDAKSFLEEHGWRPNNLIDAHVEYNMLEVWITDNLKQLSVAHNFDPIANDVDLGKDEFFVEDKRGYNCILKDMIKDIVQKGGEIILNNIVECISYRKNNCFVKANDLFQKTQKIYKADAIVCTVSLGVLQNNKIEFLPTLPPWKVKALHEMQMHFFSKVFIKMKPEFTIQKDNFCIISKQRGFLTTWMKYRNSNKNLYMCYLGGQEAKRVETLDSKTLIQEIEQLFSQAFKHMLPNNFDSTIFRPLEIAVTNWSNDSRFCGAYSLYPVHAFQEVPFQDFTRGLSGGINSKEGFITLYFAGEAFDDEFNGWVQGAYRSGEMVAKSILGTMD